MRTGLMSESAGSGESARYEIAQRILMFLERTQTAIVRRRLGKSALRKRDAPAM